jgi:hypothetical protein
MRLPPLCGGYESQPIVLTRGFLSPESLRQILIEKDQNLTLYLRTKIIASVVKAV